MSDNSRPVTHAELHLILSPILDKQTEQLEVSKETNKSLQELALSIRDLASEKKHLESEVEKVSKQVEETQKLYGSTWEFMKGFKESLSKWVWPIIFTGILASVATSLIASGVIKVA